MKTVKEISTISEIGVRNVNALLFINKLMESKTRERGIHVLQLLA